jgi:hypothetical protein
MADGLVGVYWKEERNILKACKAPLEQSITQWVAVQIIEHTLQGDNVSCACTHVV